MKECPSLELLLEGKRQRSRPVFTHEDDYPERDFLQETAHIKIR